MPSKMDIFPLCLNDLSQDQPSDDATVVWPVTLHVHVAQKDVFIEDGGGVSDSLPCTFVRIYSYLHTFLTSGKNQRRVSLYVLSCTSFNAVSVTRTKLLILQLAQAT